MQWAVQEEEIFTGTQVGSPFILIWSIVNWLIIAWYSDDDKKSQDPKRKIFL